MMLRMQRMTCNLAQYRISSKMIVFLSLLVGLAASDADVLRDWYSWHSTCHRYNQTMLSWPMWMDRGRPDLNISYPVWLYGFEIEFLTGLSKTRTFTISQLVNHKEARTRCVIDTSSFEPGLFALETAKSLCAKHQSKDHFSFPKISPKDLKEFQISADIIDVPFWIQPVNMQAFLGATNATTLCYLLDQEGLVKKEKCSEKYSSVCVNAAAHDTITYLGSTSSVPFYRSALTSDDSSTSSSYSATHASSNATQFTERLLTILVTLLAFLLL